ncbi:MULTISPECIES: hypothetical protein [unclassified Arcicella]|uniref:hypothetical protein n=1 Tax=unclassified Arcicella TaxID=2644986 RepID=UPI00285DB5D0|nr:MULTISPECIES: hypothetical protein [unclassified Arcicella]MDR6560079.1 hypothetical protein [Arcicella sp. BE51]MDR6810314.1 hypothetical protein [Arcicella sp. BE140]MDR6821664.1 hypothetical protein [Arcicella sp. BE139]
MKMLIKTLFFICSLLITFIGQAQTEPSRVSFTIKNPSLKNRLVGFSSYNTQLQKITGGYGYSLNALASHAVNLPSPVYVYQEKNGMKELFCVVTQKDDGKVFFINQNYEITREQYLDFARAEMVQKNHEKEKDENSIESIAKKMGIKLVGVKIKGASWFPLMAHIRYELPWGNDKQIGFSTSLSKAKGRYVFLPVGTKIYQCSDKYWDRNVKFTEKLLLTIEGSKDDYTVSLQ